MAVIDMAMGITNTGVAVAMTEGAMSNLGDNAADHLRSQI